MGNRLNLGRRTARLLTTHYVLAIVSVAVLASAGQALVQVALSRQAHDAQVINLAGRQRNYSQALCKDLIATLNLTPIEADISWEEARAILPLWQRVHNGLITGDPLKNLPPNNSHELAQRWAELDPSYRDLEQRIAPAIEARQFAAVAVGDLLSAQRRYLQHMESVVEQLDLEARQRVHQTRILEATLFAILALVLVAEVLFIFRPVVRRIRTEIDAREQAEDAVVEREVAEVSGRLERRIGQDLHDGLGQVLTGISFQLKALQRRLATAESSSAQAEAIASTADITSQVTQAIAQTRTLARMLHPVEAEADSLGTAMRDLGSIAEKVFAVQAIVQWDDDLPIPAATVDEDSHDGLVDSPDTPPSMHLYRIAQEALSNAIRHGGAKHLWITGSVSQEHGELVIADDGSGFTPSATASSRHAPRSGMGLRIMAYRAARLGGKFALEHRPEGGMRVTVRWPLAL